MQACLRSEQEAKYQLLISKGQGNDMEGHMRDLTQKKLTEEEIFKGYILRVRKDTAQMPDGQIVEREVVEHPGGVGIALEDEDGRFFMVTQWRYAQAGDTGISGRQKGARRKPVGDGQARDH